MNLPLGLYEFLAYVFPGTVALAVLALLPGRYSGLLAGLDPVQGVTMALAMGFLFGHVLQSVVSSSMEVLRRASYALAPQKASRAGWLYRWLYQFRSPNSELIRNVTDADRWRSRRGLLRRLHVIPYPPGLVRRIEAGLSQHHGDLRDIPRRHYFDLCFGLAGDPGNWSVFSALFKFYEGIAGAFIMAAAVFVYGGVSGRLAVPGHWSIPPTHAWLFALGSTALVFLFLERYRYFQTLSANVIFTRFLSRKAESGATASRGGHGG